MSGEPGSDPSLKSLPTLPFSSTVRAGGGEQELEGQHLEELELRIQFDVVFVPSSLKRRNSAYPIPSLYKTRERSEEAYRTQLRRRNAERLFGRRDLAFPLSSGWLLLLAPTPPDQTCPRSSPQLSRLSSKLLTLAAPPSLPRLGPSQMRSSTPFEHRRRRTVSATKRGSRFLYAPEAEPGDRRGANPRRLLLS